MLLKSFVIIHTLLGKIQFLKLCPCKINDFLQLCWFRSYSLFKIGHCDSLWLNLNFTLTQFINWPALTWPIPTFAFVIVMVCNIYLSYECCQLPAVWQCYQFSGNVASCLAMLPDVWQSFCSHNTWIAPNYPSYFLHCC